MQHQSNKVICSLEGLPCKWFTTEGLYAGSIFVHFVLNNSLLNYFKSKEPEESVPKDDNRGQSSEETKRFCSAATADVSQTERSARVRAQTQPKFIRQRTVEKWKASVAGHIRLIISSLKIS